MVGESAALFNEKGVVASSFATTPYKYRRKDLNLHTLYGYWILSPARLPFRHSGAELFLVSFSMDLVVCQPEIDRFVGAAVVLLHPGVAMQLPPQPPVKKT
jgi:hypothetical protein